MEKKCNRCGNTKKLTEFCKSKQIRSGYTGQCKKCKYEVDKKYVERNRDKIRENSAKYREKNREKILAYQYNWAKTVGKESVKKSNAKRDMKKVKARWALNKRIECGHIKRPGHCSKCKKECVPHGHHDDYSKPLDVIWVCTQCHKEIHAKIKKENPGKR